MGIYLAIAAQVDTRGHKQFELYLGTRLEICAWCGRGTGAPTVFTYVAGVWAMHYAECLHGTRD